MSSARYCAGSSNLAGLDAGKVDGMIIASVVPPIDSSLAAMAQRYFHTEPVFVTHQTDTGLRICYDDPREVGADRVVNAVAALAKYGGPCIVVDSGDGDHVRPRSRRNAGIIWAESSRRGSASRFDALFARTARLPRVDFREPEKLIGTNTTVGSVQSGLY